MDGRKLSATGCRRLFSLVFDRPIYRNYKVLLFLLTFSKRQTADVFLQRSIGQTKRSAHQ